MRVRRVLEATVVLVVALALVGMATAVALDADDEVPGVDLPNTICGTCDGSLDATSDAHDVFRVPLREGQRFDATLSADPSVAAELRLLGPGTSSVSTDTSVAVGHSAGVDTSLTYRAPTTTAGTQDYYLDVETASGVGTFTLAYEMGPILSCSPSSLDIALVQGSTGLGKRLLRVGNDAGGTLAWRVTDNASWLTVSPTSGTGARSILVSASARGRRPGWYRATITISASGAGAQPRKVPVLFRVLWPTCVKLSGSGVVASGGTRALTVTSKIGRYGLAGDPPDRYAVIDIQRRPAGQGSFSLLRKVTTNVRGQARFAVKSEVNTSYRAVRAATGRHAGDTSNIALVRARYRVTMALGAATYLLGDLGRSYPYTGRVYPTSTAANKYVQVQVLRGGRWVRLSTRKLDGSATVQGVFSGSGKWSVRLYMPASGTNLSGTSAARTFDLGSW
jgi:hypothetical protein